MSDISPETGWGSDSPAENQFDGCLVAKAFRAAIDVDPDAIRDVYALRSEGQHCIFQGKDGEQCKVEDLMVFPHPPISIGYKNICALQNDHKAFNRARYGSALQRVQRLGRNVLRSFHR